eukprot:c11167_g1_i1.p1 GENE.c11167_g1_i1~~c11167_g1_i1.p1  ORF type:complete len:374 (+),score=72.38 c11167_g1_i1:25-1146(+)
MEETVGLLEGGDLAPTNRKNLRRNRFPNLLRLGLALGVVIALLSVLEALPYQHGPVAVFFHFFIPILRRATFLRRSDLWGVVYETDNLASITMVTNVVRPDFGTKQSKDREYRPVALQHNQRFAKQSPVVQEFILCDNTTWIHFRNQRMLSHFNKLVCLEAILQAKWNRTISNSGVGGTTENEWLWWIDEDLLILDNTFDPRKYIPKSSSKFLVMGLEDDLGPNSGSIFIRVCPGAIELISQWLRDGREALESGPIKDQDVFFNLWCLNLKEPNWITRGGFCVPNRYKSLDAVIETNSKGVVLQSDSNRVPGIQFVPLFWFNPYPTFGQAASPYTCYMYGDPVVHMLGLPTREKNRLILEYSLHGDGSFTPRE